VRQDLATGQEYVGFMSRITFFEQFLQLMMTLWSQRQDEVEFDVGVTVIADGCESM
jgi:hypothetical protein